MSESITTKLAANRHVSYEMLGLYVLGDLSVEASLAAEEHLAWCARCNRELPRVEAVIAALRPCGVPALAVR